MTANLAGIFRSTLIAAILAFMTVNLGGCADSGPRGGQAGNSQIAPAQTPAGAGAAEAAAASASIAYRLGAGDKLRVIVYGEQDLTGEFDVTGSGKVSFPLIGQVQATGLTLEEFEQEIAGKLEQGYLTNPKVSAEVLNYRPFYIIGEVDKPGQYPYTNDMTVLNAIAVGGGYTYRANTDSVYITRGNGSEVQYPANQSIRVLPGDVVRVPERFF